ncbi:CPBP family glutamic-type intramembrane protease [Candidatus Marinimicrobia bacterium]|nr:CPBP family glutamic-type intramembrane protease [Candidatus Neomarinimicrobiota bacterium]
MNLIIKYLEYTRTPIYSLLFTLPFFLIYEVGIFLTSNENLNIMRNGADALMRQILSTFGLVGLYWMGAIFFIAIILTFLVQRKYWYDIEIFGNYLIIMVFESLFWSLLLYFFMSNVYLFLMNPNGEVLIQQITLAIGAGIYEEFFFRVVLILLISSILALVFNWNKKINNWLSMIIAAGIFSAFHFIGDYADFFSFKIFMVRFLAGIILGTLYFFRGFGITAWSHSIYDLIIITKITTQ